MTRTSAVEFVPRSKDLGKLKKAVQSCEGCELFRHATQAVFGEGFREARMMLIGEAPGDQEDLAGHPFVGPAGRLLDEAFRKVGIDRSEVYLTNAVKHFKFTFSGKRRLHAKPSAREVTACKPWLEAEVAAVKPELIVCLGATAAQSLLGSAFRLTASRGQILSGSASFSILATYHPSAILRAPEAAQRAQKLSELQADLNLAVAFLSPERKGASPRRSTS